MTETESVSSQCSMLRSVTLETWRTQQILGTVRQCDSATLRRLRNREAIRAMICSEQCTTSSPIVVVKSWQCFTSGNTHTNTILQYRSIHYMLCKSCSFEWFGEPNFVARSGFGQGHRCHSSSGSFPFPEPEEVIKSHKYVNRL